VWQRRPTCDVRCQDHMGFRGGRPLALMIASSVCRTVAAKTGSIYHGGAPFQVDGCGRQRAERRDLRVEKGDEDIGASRCLEDCLPLRPSPRESARVEALQLTVKRAAHTGPPQRDEPRSNSLNEVEAYAESSGNLPADRHAAMRSFCASHSCIAQGHRPCRRRFSIRFFCEDVPMPP